MQTPEQKTLLGYNIDNISDYGKVIRNVLLPSGKLVDIRERNGEDDGLLARLVDMAQNKVGISNEFIQAIIVRDHDKGARLTLEEADALKVNDRYYISLINRILSLGNIAELVMDCEAKNCGTKEIKFEEDLLRYVLGSEDPEAVKPYGNGKSLLVEFEVGEYKLRFKNLTGKLEASNNKYQDSEININTPLLLRELEIFEEDKWQKVGLFKRFNPNQMSQMRKVIIEQDYPWNPKSIFTCPKCKTQHIAYPIINTAFYFPGGI